MESVKQIMKLFRNSFEKEWFETYWAFDIHGTIFKSTYDLNESKVEFYPFAKETLELLSNRPDIKMILWTSSYPHEIESYLEIFEDNLISFDHINENPDISSNHGNFGYYENKFYFNILFDDKSGFNPETEWREIYDYLKYCNKTGYLPDPQWTTKF